jgi:hypothetical protein
MRSAAVAALLCGLAVGFAAQSPAPEPAAERFEVASIKPALDFNLFASSPTRFALVRDD